MKDPSSRRPVLRAVSVVVLAAAMLAGAATAVVLFSRDLERRGEREACITEAAEVEASIAAYRARHDDALPPGDAPAAVAATLAAAELLDDRIVEFAGRDGWSYEPVTGRIDDSGCASRT